eukprot:GHRQ01005165.1.p1 GENE.GHRQ01005165.1~~GHRQ01005165.1.p1  ORF type:complete len:290 (+),score=73.65 GHRQ01005165.1:296-1165(+)
MGHGTHVSGIIGALNNDIGVIGVMPGTPIVGLKILTSNGDGELSDVIDAMNWLLETRPNGTASEPNPDGKTNAQVHQVSVVNMSLGIYRSSLTEGLGGTLCDIVRRLEEAGVVVVAAASNEGQPSNNIAPAACPAAISVTAMDPGDGDINTNQTVPDWSNYYWLINTPVGGYVPWNTDKMARTVAAPGVSINSTCSTPRSKTGYCELSGTSQATPFVAGIYARCFASGACLESLGQNNSYIPIEEFTAHSVDNPGYGFSRDPIRMVPNSQSQNANASRYFGYLVWADAY